MVVLAFVDAFEDEGRIGPDLSLDYDGPLDVEPFLAEAEETIREEVGDSAEPTRRMSELMVRMHEELEVTETWLEEL